MASELIEAAKRGERIKTNSSLFDIELPRCPTGYAHKWRVILCEYPLDVVECCKCGRQAVTECDFDEEYD